MDLVGDLTASRWQLAPAAVCLSSCLAASRRHEDGGGFTREHPDVTAAVLQLHLCFIDMQHRSCDQLREQHSVGLAISADEHAGKLGTPTSSPGCRRFHRTAKQ